MLNSPRKPRIVNPVARCGHSSRESGAKHPNEEYVKRLRKAPIDHRPTVPAECGVRVVILLTTNNVELIGCIPYLQAMRSSPNP